MTLTPITLNDHDASGALTDETFARLQRGLDVPNFRIAQNAITQVTAEDVALRCAAPARLQVARARALAGGDRQHWRDGQHQSQTEESAPHR